MKHHYLPRFYLSGFSLTGRRDDTLWVFDKSSTKQWKSTPANSAHQRDYYRVELGDGGDPNAFEQSLAQVEAQVAPAVQRLISSQTVPRGEDFDCLMNFVALMTARVPGARSAIADPMKEIAKSIMQLTANTPETWESTIQSMKDRGIDVGANLEYAKVRDFVFSDRYEIGIDQNWEINMLLQKIDIVLPLLAQRNWSVLVAKEDAPDYICSDRPVALEWTTPMPPILGGPGFAMKNALLTFPISRRLALSSSFDGSESVVEADESEVGLVNSMTAKYAQRFLYSATSDFAWIGSDGKIRNRTDLAEAIRESQEQRDQD